MEGFLSMKIERHAFKTELEVALRSKLGLEAKRILFCSERLPRGGFLVQLNDNAEASLDKLADQDVSLSTKGTWFHIPPSTGPSGHSNVAEGIGEEIPDDEIIEDLVYSNDQVHKWKPEDVKRAIIGVRRLKRRSKEGKWLNCRSIRLFADSSLTQVLLQRGGFFVNNLARHCRPYKPPSFRCLRKNGTYLIALGCSYVCVLMILAALRETIPLGKYNSSFK